jgi:hypothetical protein
MIYVFWGGGGGGLMVRRCNEGVALAVSGTGETAVSGTGETGYQRNMRGGP